MVREAQELDAENLVMQRLNIWFTKNTSSVEIVMDNGVTRSASSNSMPATIANMDNDDRELLVRFCRGVIECAAGDCKRLEGW